MDDEFPLVAELPIPPDPEAAFRRLSSQPYCLFLDSAQRSPRLGRYSFLTADPFATLELDAVAGARLASGADPLGGLAAALHRYATPARAGLPPFQGGAAGLWGYDLGRTLERLPATRYDEFRTPWLAVGLYDVVLAFDHQEGRAWIISQGFPELDRQARRERAKARLQYFSGVLEGRIRGRTPSLAPPPCDGSAGALTPLAITELAPSFSTPGPRGLVSNFSPELYLAAVRRGVEYIYAGDVFQVNLSQRLLFPASGTPVELYLRLRQRNPAPFAAYFDWGRMQIASASPERLLSVADSWVETRPIKGTRPRTAWPEADLYAAEELRHSEKDRAENVMIVDLMRNDLSRVCRDDTVRVDQLCRLETYQFVQHLVSTVRGQLAPDRDRLDLLRAVFPGGSITGAPKIRAMEIIAELEPTSRGPYCGSLGYLGFDGSLDLNILIRTITASRGWWQLPVGGGVVAQSDPRQEYEETWYKATGLVRSLLP